MSIRNFAETRGVMEQRFLHFSLGVEKTVCERNQNLVRLTYLKEERKKIREDWVCSHLVQKWCFYSWKSIVLSDQGNHDMAFLQRMQKRLFKSLPWVDTLQKLMFKVSYFGDSYAFWRKTRLRLLFVNKEFLFSFSCLKAELASFLCSLQHFLTLLSIHILLHHFNERQYIQLQICFLSYFPVVSLIRKVIQLQFRLNSLIVEMLKRKFLKYAWSKCQKWQHVTWLGQ